MLCLLALWLAMPAARSAGDQPGAQRDRTRLCRRHGRCAGGGERLFRLSAAGRQAGTSGLLQGINLERVLALKPDLILAWRGGNPQRVLDQLAAFGIPIFYADATPSKGSPVAGQAGAIQPAPEQAHQAAEGLRRQFAALKQQYAANPSRRVLLQFGTQPLFTSAGATLQSQVLALCGGQNVFADSRTPWPQISREQVLARQPQAIVITGGAKEAASVKAFWPRSCRCR
ncbi:vitamin B12-binding protein-like [Nilaparvata lugens]|uniref:vitamin B12-binding protein-like n=1 Tax=Nilaparvata lugens TaxID=108931 RepID=UPI00193DE739|nr:vitamin B12-binding protein-like [Nilaparvata lugens]